MGFDYGKSGSYTRKKVMNVLFFFPDLLGHICVLKGTLGKWSMVADYVVISMYS